MKKRLIAALLLGLVGHFPTLLVGATISWIGGSGDWNTAVNWSGGALPGTNDDVVIGSGPYITVTHSADTHVVKSILSQQAFVLSGGSLTVSNTVQVNNTFILSGGTLVRGTVLRSTDGQSITVTSGTLDEVTVNGDMDVGNSSYDAILTVVNGLVLNGTVRVGNPTNYSYGRLDFDGSQTLGGSGVVIFGNHTGCNLLRVLNNETTLTLGPGITVRGHSGTVGYNPNCYGGPSDVSVVNQGTIAADVSGGTIYVQAQSFINQGKVQGLNGGSLSIDSIADAAGLLISGGGTLTLDGNWRNSGGLTGNGSTRTLPGNLTKGGASNVTKATLNLGGSFTMASLGVLNRSGGTVNL